MDNVLDYIVNVDVYLGDLVEVLGLWVYAVIFVVIFAEIGLVVLTILPGESLLLASGTLASLEILHIAVLAPLLFVAAFAGILSNFLIGRFAGRWLLSKPWRFLDPANVTRVRQFYDRHGALTIAVSRFLPVLRTLAPFMAGVARMEVRRLALFAAIAAVAWVGIFLGSGYGLGTADWVRRYLAVVLVGIVIVPGLPSTGVYLVQRWRRRDAR
jgi:membrane-associated protein